MKPPLSFKTQQRGLKFALKKRSAPPAGDFGTRARPMYPSREIGPLATLQSKGSAATSAIPIVVSSDVAAPPVPLPVGLQTAKRPRRISTIPACKVTSVHGVEPRGLPIMTDISSAARQPIKTDIAPVARQPSPQPSLPPAAATPPPGPAASDNRRGYWQNSWVAPGHLTTPVRAAKPLAPSTWGARSVVSAPGVAHQPGAAAASSANEPIGGLRNLAPTMKRLSHVMHVGTRIHHAFEKMLDEHPGMVEEALSYVGRTDCSTMTGALVGRSQQCLFEALETILPGFQPSPQEVDCGVNTALLQQWQQAAKDPDECPVDWLLKGAPAGITQEIPSRNIFPTYSMEEDSAEVSPDDLRTSEDFCNYSGVEGDAEVAAEIKRLVALGYAREFTSLSAAEAFTKGKIVLSKIGVIKKIRAGIMRLRMVIDSKASRVSKATRKFERTTLPRVLDVVQDQLTLLVVAQTLRHQGVDADLEHLIADFKDAFFVIPNHPKERRFFCVEFGGKILVMMRTTQGSRGAPLTWARLAALITRLTMSVIGVAQNRISTYVDDPIILAVGTAKQRRRVFATVLLLWCALQLPLSLNKAVIGADVTWTSAVFCPLRSLLTVRVKQAIVDDTAELLQRFLKGNYIRLKDLRSFTGKVTHIASLVILVRPFLAELYAALYSPDAIKSGFVWTRQTKHTLVWIAALLAEADFRLERRFTLEAFQGLGTSVVMCLDASPWGLGGFLVENDKIVAYFSSAIGEVEQNLLSISVADCACQQTVEALAVLAALRCWKHRWRGQPIVLRVKSDSISALVLTLNLKTRGKSAGIVARELALDVAASEYAPHVAEHIPGIENTLADALSRQFEPGFQYKLPLEFAAVTETVLPPRGIDYFRTLQPPAAYRPIKGKESAAAGS